MGLTIISGIMIKIKFSYLKTLAISFQKS